jgi:hypothetical protein
MGYCDDPVTFTNTQGQQDITYQVRLADVFFRGNSFPCCVLPESKNDLRLYFSLIKGNRSKTLLIPSVGGLLRISLLLTLLIINKDLLVQI